jgi:hypothetical protein
MFASCEPLEIKNSDYFIFGHFYGYCVGEGCVEIFKIEGENLYEDENDFYPTSTDFNMAKWKMLDKTEYEKVKNIGEFIPEELLNENKKVIGQPDAGDWGGIYIEIKVGEVHKFWLMDKMRSNVPEEYHEFLDKLEEKINLLQNTQ